MLLVFIILSLSVSKGLQFITSLLEDAKEKIGRSLGSPIAQKSFTKFENQVSGKANKYQEPKKCHSFLIH